MSLFTVPAKRRASFARGFFAACVAAVVFDSAAFVPARAAAPPPEIRALWVTRASLTSLSSVTAMVRAAHANGFNALFVQVRGRGDAFFSGGVEQRAAALANQPPTFDPLEETIAAARELGIQVHAWVNVNLVASATELPASREHVIYRHPEWLMVPRALALELLAADPTNPAYLGKLSRWSRAQPQEIEGLYVSPIQTAAAEHAEAIVRDLVARYPLAGVHLDYLRYPNDQFDYSRAALAEFRADLAAELLPAELQRLDARAVVDPLVFVDSYPERWTRFRTSRLTSLRQTRQKPAQKPAFLFEQHACFRSAASSF